MCYSYNRGSDKMKKTIKMFSLILISIFAINITNVKADEELDKQFDEILKKETKDGVYEINYAVKPRSYNEFDINHQAFTMEQNVMIISNVTFILAKAHITKNTKTLLLNGQNLIR